MSNKEIKEELLRKLANKEYLDSLDVCELITLIEKINCEGN